MIEQLRAKYKEALPDLEFLNQGIRVVDENKFRNKMLLDFVKLQGYEEKKIKKLEDILARAKDPSEAIEEFRKFKDDSNTAQKLIPKTGKHIITKGESDLMRKLNDGLSLVQTLNQDKFLLQRD